MASEIERKFLVKSDAWRAEVVESMRIRQGYIVGSQLASVRVRLSGDRAWLNLKSATVGVSRGEFDYEIPAADGRALLETLCSKPLIEKTRFFVNHAGHRWEIDVFEGDNAGLVVAEVELQSEDEPVELPPWAGDEVSSDERYYNAVLAQRPYRLWKRDG